MSWRILSVRRRRVIWAPDSQATEVVGATDRMEQDLGTEIFWAGNVTKGIKRHEAFGRISDMVGTLLWRACQSEIECRIRQEQEGWRIRVYRRSCVVVDEGYAVEDEAMDRASDLLDAFTRGFGMRRDGITIHNIRYLL